MQWIAIVLMLIYAYVLQVLAAQEQFRKGRISPLDANAIVQGVMKPNIRRIVTFTGFAIVVSALVLFIVSTGWWTPAWFLGSLFAGQFAVRFSGNPLLGETFGDRWLNK